MRSVLALGMVAVVLGFAACDDSSSGDDDSGPLFTVDVADTNGQPVAGLRVGRSNLSVYTKDFSSPPMACPSTPISFSLPVEGDVLLTVHDYYGRPRRTLMDGVMEPGAHVVAWNGLDDSGFMVVSGFYQYRLTAVDSAEQVFRDSAWMVLEYGWDTAGMIIGTTDSRGVYYSNDTLLFPCLLGSPPVLYTRDEFGNVSDSIVDFYVDGVIITLSDSAQPDKFMFFDRELRVGENRFDLVWDPTKAQQPGR